MDTATSKIFSDSHRIFYHSSFIMMLDVKQVVSVARSLL